MADPTTCPHTQPTSAPHKNTTPTNPCTRTPAATPTTPAAAGAHPTRSAHRLFPARRGLAAAAAMAAIAGLGVVAGPASPAGALVTVATSGTTMTVTLTGAEDLDVRCVAGVVTVNTKTGSPTVPCATFSKLTVNGDSSKQTIDGRDLEVAAFAAKPYLVAALGDGPDIVDTTSRADSIDMGPGDDRLYAWRSVNETLLEGGAGTDYIGIQGDEGVDDTIIVSSTNTNATITHEVGGVVRTHIAKNFESTEIGGKSGNDTLDASGITTGSSLKNADLYGGAGDDIVRGPQFDADIFAGPGTNQIFGGPGTDNIGSEGNGDVIKTGGGSGDRVYDRNSGRSGRVIDNPHNQTLNVAVQWGVIGIALLWAMWLWHLRLFRGDGLVAWIGLLVVVQNIFTSLFNSHVFDFHEGWIYVLGVGVAGGMVLKQDAGKAGEPR